MERERERFLLHAWPFDSTKILLYLKFVISISCYQARLASPHPRHYSEVPGAADLSLASSGKEENPTL